MLECQRSKFRLPEEITYLNCAYMGPMLSSTVEVGKHGILAKQDPSKIQVNDFFEPTDKLRSECAKLINCSEPERIAVIPSVSYGIANVLNNISIPPQSKILIVGEQFPSNAYPWFRIAEQNQAKIEIIRAPDIKVDRGRIWNEKLINAIDEKTSVVAIGICHWADGTLFDIPKIREKSKGIGAALIIDGTQSIGALPFDWEEIQPDALICAGYKWMLGPYSLGFACYGPMFDSGIPIEENWINRKNSEDFAGLVEYEEQYQPGALRYEVGEHSNFILVPMLLDSVTQINRWGADHIQQYCQSITLNAVKELRDNGFWIEDEEFRGHHLFGIRIPGSLDINRIKKALNEARIYVSYRGSSIRVSPYLYNTENHIRKLADCLLNLL